MVPEGHLWLAIMDALWASISLRRWWLDLTLMERGEPSHNLDADVVNERLLRIVQGLIEVGH